MIIRLEFGFSAPRSGGLAPLRSSPLGRDGFNPIYTAYKTEPNRQQMSVTPVVDCFNVIPTSFSDHLDHVDRAGIHEPISITFVEPGDRAVTEEEGFNLIHDEAKMLLVRRVFALMVDLAGLWNGGTLLGLKCFISGYENKRLFGSASGYCGE